MQVHLIKTGILIAFAILVGCRTTDNTLPVDIDRCPVGSVRSDSIAVIPIDSTVCLGKANKIICRNSIFYILDREQNMIFAVGADGRHVCTLNRRGRGRGEYLDARDFDISSDGRHLYVLSAFMPAVLVYDIGETIQYADCIPLPAAALGFAVSKQGIWLSDMIGCGQTVPLSLFSGDTVTTIVAPRGVPDDEQNSHFKEQSIFRSADSIVFNPRFSTDIYTLHDRSAGLRFRFTSKYIPDIRWLRQSDFGLNAEEGMLLGFQSVYNIRETTVCEPWGGMTGFLVCNNGRWCVSPDIDGDKIRLSNILGATPTALIGMISKVDVERNDYIGKAFPKQAARILREDAQAITLHFIP